MDLPQTSVWLPQWRSNGQKGRANMSNMNDSSKPQSNVQVRRSDSGFDKATRGKPWLLDCLFGFGRAVPKGRGWTRSVLLWIFLNKTRFLGARPVVWSPTDPKIIENWAWWAIRNSNLCPNRSTLAAIQVADTLGSHNLGCLHEQPRLQARSC